MGSQRRRRVFTSFLVCGLLFGSVFFIKLRLSGRSTPTPVLVPNVSRFRTSRVCSQRALVLVSSSAAHSDRRQAIRETWAHPKVTRLLDIGVAFGVENAGVERSLDWEAEIYGDIFQSQRDPGSAAARVLQLLKVGRAACAPQPKFVLKTEDDVFVNVHSLVELLDALEPFSSSNTMWCLEWNRRLDGNADTWVVLKTQSSYGTRPKYCAAKVYLMTGRALDAILRRHDVQTGKNMLPEDVYVTGVLTKEADVSVSLLGERFASDDPPLDTTDQVVFSYLGDRLEEGTDKLWSKLLANERHSEPGL